jgi:recombination protein RecT
MGKEKALATVDGLNFPQMMNLQSTKAKFENVLGKGTASFLSSLFTMWTEDKKLQDCNPQSILSAAKQAAILNLPIMKQLGYAYVIPYNDWRTGQQVAQFQLGYKGLLQLAMRSGVFKNLNSVEIYEGELKSRNRITGEIEIDDKAAPTKEVVGYVAYMELTNGFTKMFYMTKAEVEEHAKKYSSSYAYDLEKKKKSSVWSTNFDAMAKKTVLKLLLSKYAPTSIEMQGNDLTLALQADQAAISPDGNFQYVDNGDTIDLREESAEETIETVNAETGENISDQTKADDDELPSD